MSRPVLVRVWDLPIRLFHWSLATSVAISVATGFLGGAEAIRWHVGAGLVAVGLVLARIVWGFTGPTHARFRDFAPSAADVVEHVRSDSPRHLGHNPLGALMVFGLITVMLVIGVSGLAMLGGMFKTGPLAFWSFEAGRSGREIHEFAAWAVLGLVALHLGGVVFESLRSRENLARAMLTGVKEARPGDHPVREIPARIPLAVFVLLLAGSGLWAANASLAARALRGMPVAFDATTRAECSACHMAYHPSLLPADSWRALMAGLPDHFGEDASLDTATVAEIEGWLVANAAEGSDTLPAHVFARVAPEAPFTISETPFWNRLHGDLPDALFRRASIKSRSNCAACHADAESGLFSPFSIHVPKE
ncbi:cytochrome b/b6 domain-containing protein [Cereibacter sphaeroides]|uniref:cytochrome b/b6 domain-containing protein n=1 Tax=Cereibacter sphaeroides TaxID=1063 RepID=UPI001F27739E|nr:cytochrome b/b6 domain-containing protein [Cereibacter sphaeroides]MCE6953164.1 cytochrome b/b6 domain-containing protein [Cereibacter sphaeroides]